jgi:hypothetical protein
MVPWIATNDPAASPPTEENSVPGPNRQLAGSTFGVTMGLDEVGLATEVGVSKGPATYGVDGGGVGEKSGNTSITGAINKLKEVARSGFEATGTG